MTIGLSLRSVKDEIKCYNCVYLVCNGLYCCTYRPVVFADEQDLSFSFITQQLLGMKTDALQKLH